MYNGCLLNMILIPVDTLALQTSHITFDRSASDWKKPNSLETVRLFFFFHDQLFLRQPHFHIVTSLLPAKPVSGALKALWTNYAVS